MTTKNIQALLSRRTSESSLSQWRKTSTLKTKMTSVPAAVDTVMMIKNAKMMESALATTKRDMSANVTIKEAIK